MCTWLINTLCLNCNYSTRYARTSSVAGSLVSLHQFFHSYPNMAKRFEKEAFVRIHHCYRKYSETVVK